MRIATALLLIVMLLALPACRMNERMSGAAFGGIGGAVVGGALGGSFAGGVVGGLAGGVLGYLVGDYIADKRERCAPPVQGCDPCAPPTYAPVQPPCDPCAQPTYQQAPQYAPPCAPPTNYPSGPRVGAVKARNPNVAAARRAIEHGRRAATLPEAQAAYEQAVRLDPQSADAWNALGLTRKASGNGSGADAAFRRALALDPHHYAARQNLDWVASEVR